MCFMCIYIYIYETPSCFFDLKKKENHCFSQSAAPLPAGSPGRRHASNGPSHSLFGAGAGARFGGVGERRG